MIKKVKKSFLLIIFAALALSGCFSPYKGDEATLTLFLGGSNGRAADDYNPLEEILPQMTHKIELKGPTGKHSYKMEKGDKSLTVTVTPGHWDITIQALLNGVFLTQGSGGAELKAGKNNTVAIRMDSIDDKDLIVFKTSDYLLGVDYPETPIPGSLRYAIEKAAERETNSVIRVMLPQGSKIELKSTLSISSYTNTTNVSSANLTIEGNGVTLTPASEFFLTNDALSMLDNYNTVTINRVHFTGGGNTNYSYGGAISNYGDLTLESCIFSGNKNYNGGAINNTGSLSVKGCTFYDNHAGEIGGAIYNDDYTGVINKLIGNLFFGNTANSYNIIFYNPIDSDNSSNYCGYNAVDVGFGNGPDQCGWEKGTGDTYKTDSLIDTATFKPVSGLNSIVPPDLQGFPTTDFYGNQRTSGAPGAVDH